MNNILLKHIFRFVFLVLLQVLIINHVQIAGVVNPYLYIMFILFLPYETPRWLLLLLAFALGFCVDIFSETLGLHTAATVFMTFFRPFLLNMIGSGHESDHQGEPSLQKMGFDWFLVYVSTMTLIHHTAFYFLEVFRFNEFKTTVLHILYSSILTIALILLTQYVFFFRKKEK